MSMNPTKINFIYFLPLFLLYIYFVFNPSISINLMEKKDYSFDIYNHDLMNFIIHPLHQNQKIDQSEMIF
jgi:hypothetical protein